MDDQRMTDKERRVLREALETYARSEVPNPMNLFDREILLGKRAIARDLSYRLT